MEPVHRQAGQAVRLPEDYPAGGKVLGLQDGLSVLPGIAEAAEPEALVKRIVGVPGEEADPDEGGKAEEPGPQPGPLLVQHVHHGAVGGVRGAGEDLPGVDPGVAVLDGFAALFGDGKNGVGAYLIHEISLPFMRF